MIKSEMLLIKRCCGDYQRISAITPANKPGDKLGIQGWIQNIRRLKNNIFLDVNDGSTCGKFQVVVPKSHPHIKTLTTGSSIRASGCIQLAPNGNFELHAQEVELIADGHVADGYPFTPKQQHPPEYVRDHLHLRARVDYIAALMRLRHRAQKAIHDFMDSADFVQINTPIVSTNDCEGAGEVFTVQPESATLQKEMSRPGIPHDQSYFDAKVFLSVSGQLHLEAMTYGLGNTYTFAPAFRAENSKSPLHLAEFYMLEAEMAFLEQLPSLARFIERMLKTITTQVLDRSAGDLEHCQRRAADAGQAGHDMTWLQREWQTLRFDDALQVVEANRKKFQTPVRPSEGFSKEQEFFLVRHCAAPVFIVDWPASQKPFYMRVSRTNPQRVDALDLLMPTVGELCGGSLRECDVERLRGHSKLPKGLEWYLELRQYGGIPTGGFGMGFERYIQLLTGVKNIRDVIPFPRYPHSCRM